MPANTPQSRKAKGRKHQQWIRDKILELYEQLEPDDVRSTSMGVSGTDIQLSPKAKKFFPFAVEAKCVEKLNFWEAYEQAQNNSNGLEPLLIVKKNHKKPIVVVDAEYFFQLQKRANEN